MGEKQAGRRAGGSRRVEARQGKASQGEARLSPNTAANNSLLPLLQYCCVCGGVGEGVKGGGKEDKRYIPPSFMYSHI